MQKNQERGKQLRFPQMFSLNSANSVSKIFVITVKGFKPATSCVRDQDATQQQQDTCERQDL